MQENDNVCQQCHKPCASPSNRLVQDACGHKKCRSCLLADIESCKQCLTSYTPVKDAERKPVSKVDDLPAITDYHTAVIHCNGKAKSTRESIIDNVEQKQEPNNQPQIIDPLPLETEKVKDKDVSKKKVILVPSHITVKSDPVSYFCTLCKKTFGTKSHIKYHKYCTGELKPYKCEICNKEFILKVQLQIHMRKHNNVKPFKCSSCPKSFSEKSKLSRHMALHSAGKNFICPDCAKAFRTKESLKVHAVIHKNEKPYACKECAAKFNNSSNLKKHMASHSTEKVHMCDQCGRRFKLKWALSVHRKSHLSIRAHSCNECSKTFVNLKELQRHMLIHAETKGYTCSICLTSFRRKDNLHRHMKNTHPGKKGDIIKNPLKVSELPKKSVVLIDNPNAVNVITASPAITKCKADTVTVPIMKQPTAISTDSRPTGTVINGPIKLAFKTPAFKSNYNITRGGEFLPVGHITKKLFVKEPADLPISSSYLVDKEMFSKPSQCSGETVLEAPALVTSTAQPNLSTYSSVLHYETSFQNKKHAMIKNIKFKVPEQYTSSFKTASHISNSYSKSTENSASRTELSSAINTSVIVNSNNMNPSDVHWRRRTSQNLVLKN